MTKTDELMLEIRRMKFDLDISMEGPRVKLLHDRAYGGRYIATADLHIVEIGPDEKPRALRRTRLGTGNTPEEALEDLSESIRDGYPAPSPFPSVEETKKAIFEHPLNGKIKIDKIDIWRTPGEPLTIEVRAQVRSSLGSARYFGQEVGAFNARGKTDREALYWLLQRLNEEFAGTKHGEFVIGCWDEGSEQFFYIKNYVCNLTWTWDREEARVFTEDARLEFADYLGVVNRARPFDTLDAATFLPRICSCSMCKHG